MDSPKKPSPVHLLAGGRHSMRAGHDPLLTCVFDSARVREPSIAYIGAASGDDKSFFKMIAGYIRGCGAGEVRLVELVSRRAKIDKARAVLEEADMVFVSGGDVEEGMEVLTERGVLPLLRGLFEGGKPFVGLSAGSIMLAREWIVWDDPNDDSTARTIPCMAFAPVLCDTHGEDEDWEELRALLLISPEGTAGYGIPTGAGLRVFPDGSLEAIGEPVTPFEKINHVVRRRPDLVPR
jgi:cyanophycinase-like exopeptidase